MLPQRNPTAGHRAVIAELLLRFPCPRDVDPDDYKARAELLARDTAALQPGLLRKAADRVAQSARGLPFASELLEAARLIVEERQRAQQPADAAPSPETELADMLAARNRDLDRLGVRGFDGELWRWVVQNGRADQVRVSGKGARARCDEGGRVQLATWCPKTREWVFIDEVGA